MTMPLTAAEWLSENSERQELAVMNIPLAMESYAKYVASFVPKDVVEAINEKYPTNCDNDDLECAVSIDCNKAALHGYSLASGESIAFGQWIKSKYTIYNDVYWLSLFGTGFYTTEQLHSLFKKESNG